MPDAPRRAAANTHGIPATAAPGAAYAGTVPLPPLVEPVAALSDAERARTARHASLRGLGETGQRRLAAAHVAFDGLAEIKFDEATESMLLAAGWFQNAEAGR